MSPKIYSLSRWAQNILISGNMMATSSNPFRKKSTQPEEDRFPSLEALDSLQTYPSLQNEGIIDDSNELYKNAAKAHEKETASKPIKKVRVISPPPLSPDSPDLPATQDALAASIERYSAYDESDPFGASETDESGQDSTYTTRFPTNVPASQDSDNSGPPANPFSKTLQDLEGSEELELQRKEEGESLKAANPTKPILDVDGFRRLLMTGQASSGGDSNALLDKTTTEADVTRSNKANEQYEQQSTVTVTQEGDADSSSAPSKEKKMPPRPPSSRHGKTLKQTSQNDNSDTQILSEPSQTHPRSRGNSDAKQRVDVEVGDENIPPSLPHSTTTPKKSVPAPPPRRGHGRTDTKTNIPIIAPLSDVNIADSKDEVPSSRSSIDSAQPKIDAIKQTSQAPAPPPPRRPNVTPKQAGITPQPSVSSNSIPQNAASTPPFAEVKSPSNPIDQPTKHSRFPAPPPPPTRTASSRRPPSIQGLDATSRRISNEGRSRDSMPRPPPPPSRQRGSSPHGEGIEKEAAIVDSSKGADILADLDALQREVDALRGKVI